MVHPDLSKGIIYQGKEKFEMNNLIIIGAGGFGRSIYSIAKGALGYKKDFVIKGFLDDNIHVLAGFESYPSVLDTINNYQPEQNDVFINSIGSVKAKRITTANILARGGRFINIIHKTAAISDGVKLGEGVIIGIHTIIDADVSIGDHSLIQSAAIIGHDVKLGSFCRIDCKVICVGGVVIDDAVTIHSSAVISHNVTIGKGSLVGAQSFVICKVPENASYYGNPAVRLK